jgi:hypothetical protein
LDLGLGTIYFPRRLNYYTTKELVTLSLADCRTLDAWLERMDANMPVVKPILVQTYGKQLRKNRVIFASAPFKYTKTKAKNIHLSCRILYVYAIFNFVVHLIKELYQRRWLNWAIICHFEKNNYTISLIGER